ncbi:hypothetical protein [Allorhizocola rhizosphaerae]|uniref:hypothetical protein n=1 Tax=Allorhizocola rhizosphaerae TaxID=1872709 RepID=UPI0013C2A21C|nr:hypothetical protein [Allorhizocola rhizosphaerae]
MSSLERRYRRLLLCYPRAYRRARADEIVGTLLELAPTGRTRPTLREAVDLVCQGMRARLGRPASRSVAVWAGLTAVLCGLFAGAIGSRVGWETARPLPSEAEARALFANAVPGHQINGIQLDQGLFSVMGRELTWTDFGYLLGLDSDLHQTSAAVGFAGGNPPVEHQQTLRTAQERLRAAGWDLHPVMSLDVDGCAICPQPSPPNRFKMSATREDSILTLELNSPQPGSGYLSIHLTRATPWTVYPAGIGIGLLGFAFGWMMFGWASRRTEGRRAVQNLAAIPYALAMLVWLAIAASGLSEKITWHIKRPRPGWDPAWEWLGLPDSLLFFHFGSVCALFALALAALPRWGARPSRQGALA